MQKKSEYVGVRLPVDLRSKLKEKAQKEFTSEGSIIKRALDFFLRHKSN